MQFGRRNMFGMPQQNPGFQPPAGPQVGGGNFTPIGRGNQRFSSNLGGQGGFPIPAGFNRARLGRGGGLNGGMTPGNLGWGALPPGAGSQGYAPGYPPQGLGIQQAMPPAQGFPQGNPGQGFIPQGPQGVGQSYGGQMPQPGGQVLQPAWEAPKKGGIKGFIGNLFAKVKR